MECSLVPLVERMRLTDGGRVSEVPTPIITFGTIAGVGSTVGTANDTPPRMMSRVVGHWRTMSSAEKLDQIEQLNRACEQMSEAGVRSRHPDASDDEVRLRVIALRLGRDLMVAAYGWDPAVQGW